MNEVLVKTGTQISFADHAGDFSPSAALHTLEQGTPTDVQLALASLANDAARQSTKFDFGATRARRYSVMAAFELASTPTAGEIIELWLAYSPSTTAGTGNPGNVAGSDSAYTGYSSNLDASLEHLTRIGEFVCTAQATATVQVGRCGVFAPLERYASLVVVNRCGIAFHTDDVECNIVFTPLVDEIQ